MREYYTNFNFVTYKNGKLNKLVIHYTSSESSSEIHIAW